jgi:hypothetical protein
MHLCSEELQNSGICTAAKLTLENGATDDRSVTARHVEKYLAPTMVRNIRDINHQPAG